MRLGRGFGSRRFRFELSQAVDRDGLIEHHLILAFGYLIQDQFLFDDII